MNSKTLEMLQKFVKEDEEENEEELEDIGQKLNMIKQKNNQNKLNDNEIIQKEDDFADLIKKINDLDQGNTSNEKIPNKEENHSENNPEINNEEFKNDNDDNKIKENQYKIEILKKIVFMKETKNKLLYFKNWDCQIKMNSENNNIESKENKIEEKKEIVNDVNVIIDIENENNEENIKILDNKENEEKENNNTNELNNNEMKLNEILTNDEEEDIDAHESNEIIIQHQNRLLSGETNNFQILNPLTQIGDGDLNINNINLDNIFSQNKPLIDINTNNNLTSSQNKQNKNLFCLSIFNIIQNRLYLFHKTLISVLKHKSIISNYYDQLYQLDKLNKKYEAILDEKSSIIINKTDEIEDLKEKIEKLRKNIKELNKKNKSLNVIQESLCAKCGGSLEESFTGEALIENQNIIKEQNEQIEKMKKEMSEIRSKYNLAELRLKDLDNIKKEFENLSGSLLKPKIDIETQTEESLLNLKNTNNNNNINIQIYNNTNTNTNTSNSNNISTNNVNKNINLSNRNKGNSKKKNIPKKNNNNFSNSTNSYMSTSLGNNKNTKNNTNENINNTELNNEIITSLRFDNSVLSNELLNLNREFNKLRNEHKVINDKNIKLVKDKKDLLDKLKQKNDMYEKYKKENEEINRLINNSKYKNIVNAETENKKLKNIIEQNDIDIKNLKNMNEKCAKKILEQNTQIEKMKNALANFLNFKQQKENLTIENEKYENEIKKLRKELDEEKNINEKNTILMNNKDKEIEKLSNEVSYYNFHIKKCKSDAERALEDAIGYQKIVRILEIQLNEYKQQLDKIKQEKNI